MYTFPLIGRLATIVGLVALTTVPARAATLTLFAEQSITISGSNNEFCGSAHSNGTVRITGNDNAVSGPFSYVGSFRQNHNNSATPVETSAQPLPAPAHDLAYYRARAQTEGTYFPSNADLGVVSGLIFAEGDIHLSGSGTTGTVTFVSAHGEISLSGSHNRLTPAVDGVLFYTATGDADITGSHSTYDGGLYAPAGSFARHGADDSNVSGPVVARTISWSGSRNHLGGECCLEASDCQPETACDMPTCESDGTCSYAKLADCIPCASDADCTDATVCNGAETCRAGACTSGTPLDCDDHDASTTDSCDPTDGCRNPPIDCDDRNVCTTDTRDPIAGCVHTPVVNGTACGDSDACNGAETCRNGACGFNAPASCDDTDACTTDACSTLSGGCIHSRIAGCISCTTVADCPTPGACATASCAAGVCVEAPVDECPRTCSPEVCGDGSDNDCDDLTDCADSDCAATCTPNEICGDCRDNDGDDLVDAQDPDCCTAPLAFGAKVLQLKPLATKGDRLRLMGVFAPAIPSGFDPSTQDTSIQIADDQGTLFCTTITADHWMPMGKRSITFWDKKGSFSNGLTDGRFKLMKNGSVVFRTHGRKATIRTPMARRVQVSVAVGDMCSQTTTALRPTRNGLSLK